MYVVSGPRVRLGVGVSALARAHGALAIAALTRVGVPVEPVEVAGPVEVAVVGGAGAAGAGGAAAPTDQTRVLVDALIDGTCEVVVVSLVGWPTAPPALTLAAVLPRGRPWLAWVSRAFPDLVDLPPGARLLTNHAYLAAQVRQRFPHLLIEIARASSDTLLARLAGPAPTGSLPCSHVPSVPAPSGHALSDHDAIAGAIVSAADLDLLDCAALARATYGPTELTPAPGQGALALIVRIADSHLARQLAAFDDPATHTAVRAEHALQRLLGLDTPLGAFARVEANHCTLTAARATRAGDQVVQLAVDGPATNPESLATDLATRLQATT